MASPKFDMNSTYEIHKRPLLDLRRNQEAAFVAAGCPATSFVSPGTIGVCSALNGTALSGISVALGGSGSSGCALVSRSTLSIASDYYAHTAWVGPEPALLRDMLVTAGDAEADDFSLLAVDIGDSLASPPVFTPRAGRDEGYPTRPPSIVPSSLRGSPQHPVQPPRPRHDLATPLVRTPSPPTGTARAEQPVRASDMRELHAEFAGLCRSLAEILPSARYLRPPPPASPGVREAPHRETEPSLGRAGCSPHTVLAGVGASPARGDSMLPESAPLLYRAGRTPHIALASVSASPVRGGGTLPEPIPSLDQTGCSPHSVLAGVGASPVLGDSTLPEPVPFLDQTGCSPHTVLAGVGASPARGDSPLPEPQPPLYRTGCSPHTAFASVGASPERGDSTLPEPAPPLDQPGCSPHTAFAGVGESP